MTREEAITRLKNMAWLYGSVEREQNIEAIDMAIEALQAEQNYVHIETYRDLYEKYIELKHKSAEPSDLISRADAIEAVAKLQKYDLDERNRLRIYAPWHNPKRIFVETEGIYKTIYTLPSADTEQVTGKLKNPCDSLLTEDNDDSKEQKSKLEHDREWIIGCIKHDGFIKTDRFDKANQIILDALADRPSGTWEHWGSPFSDESEVIDTIVCSVCGARFIEPKDEPKGEYNYCPNCGARMENTK